jgi:hypothetical protein
MVPNRTGKQCRQRYFNHLKPSVKLAEWSPLEDVILFHLHGSIGSKWALISQILKGRSDNNVKNRFHHIRRRLEKVAAKLDIDGYVGDPSLRTQIIETAKRLNAPWESLVAVTDILVYSIKENTPLMKMYYDFSFDLKHATGCHICTRCGLLAPSQETGDKLCAKTGWCQSCVEAPAYLFNDLLRIQHCLRCNGRSASSIDMID